MCAAARVNQQQFDALLHENAVLAKALAKAQTRNTEQGQGQGQVHATKVETLNKELVRLRAELIGRDTMIATLQEAMQEAQAQSTTVQACEQALAQVASLEICQLNPMAQCACQAVFDGGPSGARQAEQESCGQGPQQYRQGLAARALGISRQTLYRKLEEARRQVP